MSRSTACALLGVLALASATFAQQWGPPQEVRTREGPVVTFRAALVGSTLLVEARHAPGWHSFALDNLERARRASGLDEPETEMPTRIELSGGLETAGVWLQTAPKDLSDPEIFWYTWAFEGRALFAVPVRRVSSEDGIVHVSGQTCDERTCWGIDVQLHVPVPSRLDGSAPTLEGLEPIWQPE